MDLNKNSQIIIIVKKFFSEILLQKNTNYIFSEIELFGKISFESFFCKIAHHIVKNLDLSMYFFLLMKKNLKKKYILLDNLKILNIFSEKKFRQMKKIIRSTKDKDISINEIDFPIFQKFILFTEIDLKDFFQTNNLYIKKNAKDYGTIYKIVNNFDNFKKYFKNLSLKLPLKFNQFKNGDLKRNRNSSLTY